MQVCQKLPLHSSLKMKVDLSLALKIEQKKKFPIILLFMRNVSSAYENSEVEHKVLWVRCVSFQINLTAHS